jgi:UDP-N-acetylglucosamine 2-epimerase (non-hydrolysing)
MTKNILISVGTRPEIIKMAPVYFDLKKRGLNPVLLHTGQHTDMATSLYNIFDIVPDYTLILSRDTKDASCDLSMLSSTLLHNISNVMMQIDPAIVLVHGDTSSALMSALAAFYQKRPVAHVEAGLRSHDAGNPFPEEKNRVLIAQLAHWHFSPTMRAKQNLLAEGVKESNIHIVGNTVVDAAILGAQKLEHYQSKATDDSFAIVDKLKKHLSSKQIVMVTVHRRENQEGSIASIMQAILELMKKNSAMIVVWPVHPNPKVKKAVHDGMMNVDKTISSRIYLTEPLGYPVLLWILKNAWLILTDSGGIQEEAVAVSTPVLVLRDTTERQEIIDAGAGILVGTKKENIIKTVEALRQNTQQYDAMRNVENPYGDGTTAVKIGSILARDHSSGRKYA